MGKYIWPLPGYSRISSKYGNRVCPFHGKEFHDGIDIPATSGTTIIAFAAGEVIYSGKRGGYGNYISIKHSDGLISFYGHCKTLIASQGAKVKAGQKIATVGTTGTSTGNHLHFGLHKNGTPVNPQQYVSSKDTASNYTGASATSSGSIGTSASSSGSSDQSKKESKDITTVVIKSSVGAPGAQKSSLAGLPTYLQNGIEILIQNDRIYMPCLKDDVQLERSRKGSPAKLTFTVMNDDVLNFQEGNPVSMKFKGTPVFYGYVFSKSRSDNRSISVTAYDQIRYLKNKDTLSYKGKTYSEVLKMIAADYSLKCGSVDDTGYKIPQRIEEGTLIDILQNASDLTVVHTGRLYVLYDDFGKLTLKNIQNMKLPIVIDEETGQSYDYTSSIDSDVYNRIKLAMDNSETGEREVYVLNDGSSQGKWGQLQYYEKVDSETSAAVIKARAETLLKYYNRKKRTLSIKNVFGDIRVRGGSSVIVNMGLGDLNVRNYMCVEKVVHKFSHGLHTMDLSVSGIKGEFTA